MNQISPPPSLMIQLESDLTIENEETLLDEFIAVSQEKTSEITVDFSQVKRVDAHGLALLAMFQTLLSGSGSLLKLRTQNSDFISLFKAVGLTQIATVES